MWDKCLSKISEVEIGVIIFALSKTTSTSERLTDRYAEVS